MAGPTEITIEEMGHHTTWRRICVTVERGEEDHSQYHFTTAQFYTRPNAVEASQVAIQLADLFYQIDGRYVPIFDEALDGTRTPHDPALAEAAAEANQRAYEEGEYFRIQQEGQI